MNPPYLVALQRSVRKKREIFNAFLTDKTDCYRVFNGPDEGISGFVVERYAEVMIFQFHEGKCSLNESQMAEIADFFSQELGIKSFYLKKFVSDRSSKTADSSYYSEQPFWGEKSPDKIVCQEKGMKFEIHPYEGFSTGIFLDQRNNRDFLRHHFQNQEVLNCFAYTCAFSVACALNNNKVASIDLSRRYLDWGKTNFRLNQLDPEGHGFFAIDVFEQFKKSQKLNKIYDLIILDPPSFSRNSKGRVFSVKKDMENLVRESLVLLKPQGKLFVSSNLYSWKSTTLKTLIGSVLRDGGIRADEIALPKMPLDFIGTEAPLSSVCIQKRN